MYRRVGTPAEFWAAYEQAGCSISSTRLGRVQPLGYNVANSYTPIPYMDVDYGTTFPQSTFLAGISVPAVDHPEVEIGGPNSAAMQKNPQTDLTILQQVRRHGSWKEEEHRNFLVGLRLCGWGHWTEIAERPVKTRGAAQIGSHAQKYQHRYYALEKSRRSIHDTTEGNGLPLTVPPPPPHKSVLTTQPEDSFDHLMQTGGGHICALLGYSIVAPELMVDNNVRAQPDLSKEHVGGDNVLLPLPPASPQPPNMDNGLLPNMDPGLPVMPTLGGGDNIPDNSTEYLQDIIDFDVEIPD